MTANTQRLCAEGILHNLQTHTLGKDLRFFDTVTSTFDVAEKLQVSDGTVICAKAQTNGRGRLGRTWQSEQGGIYFSLILANRFTPEKLQLMTILCALGVQIGLSGYISCKIKWPNDIITENGMKLCGILTKLRSGDGCSDYINVGIGINANTTDFDSELRYATSVRLQKGHKVDENKILCSVLEAIEGCLDMSEEEIIGQYTQNCITAESRVRVIFAGDSGEFTGKCIGINSDGSLNIQKNDGKLISVNSGEVSVRGVYGENYV